MPIIQLAERSKHQQNTKKISEGFPQRLNDSGYDFSRKWRPIMKYFGILGYILAIIGYWTRDRKTKEIF